MRSVGRTAWGTETGAWELAGSDSYQYGLAAGVFVSDDELRCRVGSGVEWGLRSKE